MLLLDAMTSIGGSSLQTNVFRRPDFSVTPSQVGIPCAVALLFLSLLVVGPSLLCASHNSFLLFFLFFFVFLSILACQFHCWY